MNGLLLYMFEDCSVTCPDPTTGCVDACSFVGGRENPPETGEGEETYSLDFHLMTQVNLSRGRAMRVIKRDEGMTWAQKITHVYNEKAELPPATPVHELGVRID
ncbi:unnamed protein product [Cladocopium goreaui]|uniref:WWE domain-containing protein n=1 Tax=Cladocopium goreaui TaxID=2562237 RepID=A0A9P1FDU4_9DINO|nr:unnamed protein product [Cladocopium goreaui]